MDLFSHHLLSILIFLPTLGALLVLGAKGRSAVRWTALGTTLATFAVSLLLLVPFDWHSPGSDAAYAVRDGANAGGVVQLVERADWIPAFHIQYLVGMDGLSFPLVLLTTFISVLACIASWKTEKMTRGYFALFLFLETGILGTFLSLDFFLFYVFFEVSLLPMYFLIGIWGGPRKEYAAIKFFLYTLLGSIAMLVVVIGVYLSTGSFDLIALPGLLRAKFSIGGEMFGAGKAFFLLLMLAFLIKVPAVPLHTWLPDAHVEAPTPISMILAALLLKMGGYGIFRVAYPLFPDAGKTLWLLIAIIGAVSVIYGALCAMAQTDFKRLVAYSSVSHMGLVVLGAAVMTPAGVNGAMFMMIAHGITSAMLFFIVGVVYDRAHHRELSRLGGLASTMPIYATFSTVACFANLGLPALCGFVGEFLVIAGVFQAARAGSVLKAGGHATSGQIYTLAVVACVGVILTAAYMLWTLQRIFFGPTRPEHEAMPEVDQREIFVLAPLAAMAVLLGILPTVFFFTFTRTTVDALYGFDRPGRGVITQPENGSPQPELAEGK
ncbi:MAG TPA: NADH-quinone oxidoreductase subunit M [Tepidisphaeraceae bacterium]|jgi:NADH-quinone oxidoreductase subunit M|nr:NADH-quinone oxidoreductase subunit M [Tepidisphaeraceae bacterium]